MSDGLAIPADALGDPFLLVAADGRIIDMNQVARHQFGCDATQGGEVRLGDLATDPDQARDYLRRCARVGNPLPGCLHIRTRKGEFPYRCDGGRYWHPAPDGGVAVWIRLRLREKTTNPFQILSDKVERLAHEVAERRRAEARLQALVEEKELLIRELHHRIRNTLQVLASLTNIQARTVDDPAVQQPLIRQVQRINAVGLAFRTLYREGHLAEVDIRSFARALCSELASAQGRQVTAEVDFEVERLDLDAAVPFSLLLNELVSDAVDRVADSRGRFHVSLRRQPAGDFELTLSHDGDAVPDPKVEGSRIVDILVRQLEGTMSIQGGRLSMVFRQPDPQDFSEERRARG